MVEHYTLYSLINFDFFLLLSFKGGDFGIKRAKVDQEAERKVGGVSDDVGRVASGLEPNLASASMDNAASTSNISSTAGAEKSGYDHLPSEMREMRIRDEKTSHDEKVIQRDFSSCFVLLSSFLKQSFSMFSIFFVPLSPCTLAIKLLVSCIL